LGYLPQLQALAEPGLNSLMEKIASTDLGSKLMDVPKDSKVDVESDYVKRRDEAIRRQEKLKEENPMSYGAGTVGGIITGGVAMQPLAGASAATRAGRIAQGVSQGGAMGFAMNPGDKEGEVDDTQLEDRLKNGGISALTSGLFTAGVEGASAAAKASGDYFKKLANEKAVKAAGAMKGDFKTMAPDKVQSMGRDLLDEKVVTPFARPKDIAERINEKQSALINDLTNTIEKADAMGPINMETATPEQIAAFQKLRSTPEDIQKAAVENLKSKYKAAPESELAPGFGKIQQWLENRPDVMGAKDMQEIKTSLNPFLDSRDFSQDLSGMPKEGLKSLRQTLRQGVEDKANAAADLLGESGGTVRETNRKLGSLLGAEKLSENAMARDAANRTIGLTDTMAGLGGAQAGPGGPISMVTGLATGGANKLLRSYGDPLAATGLDALANQLVKVPRFAKLAQDNPTAFQAMISNMATSSKFQKADPNWSKDPLPMEMPIQKPMGEQKFDPKQDKLIEILSKNPSALRYLNNPKLKDAVLKRIQKDRQSTIENQ
jgi:soluble cytochrome b562